MKLLKKYRNVMLSPSNRQNPPLPAARFTRSAFSLLELLVVMACIGVVLGISVPAFSSISRSNDNAKSARNVAELLDLARTHAKAANTSVQVGFASDATGLKVAVISGREGTNFTTVSRVHRFPLVRMATIEANGRPEADLDLTPTRGGLLPSFNTAGQTFERVIEFNTRGEARALTSGLSRCIEIGLLPNVNGGTPEPLKKNFGVVQVAGLSGGVAVFR